MITYTLCIGWFYLRMWTELCFNLHLTYFFSIVFYIFVLSFFFLAFSVTKSVSVYLSICLCISHLCPSWGCPLCPPPPPPGGSHLLAPQSTSDIGSSHLALSHLTRAINFHFISLCLCLLGFWSHLGPLSDPGPSCHTPPCSEPESRGYLNVNNSRLYHREVAMLCSSARTKGRQYSRKQEFGQNWV